MLAITAGAMIGFFFAQRRSNELLAENRRLRFELGELHVPDPGKMWIRALPLKDNLIWQWRIYVPAECDINVKIHGESNPQPSAPYYAEASMLFKPGQSTLEARVKKVNGAYVLNIVQAGERSSMDIGVKVEAPGYSNWVTEGCENGAPMPKNITEIRENDRIQLFSVASNAQRGAKGEQPALAIVLDTIRN